MNTNNVPLNGIGSTGPLELMAKHLSLPSSATGARPDKMPVAASATAVTRLMTKAQARDATLVGRAQYTRYAPVLRGAEGRAIAVGGLWSYVGFVGASLLVVGLLRLTHGGAGTLAALGLVLGGGALATFAWRSAWNILDRLDQSSAGKVGVTAAAGVASVDTDSRFAPRIASAHPRTALSAG